MTLRRNLCLAAVAFANCAPTDATGTLGVCLDDSIPPLSWKQGDEPRGFDLAVARAISLRLGRQLSIQWVRSKADKDVNPAEQANALLSDGRCHLIGGFPLFASSPGEAGAERSKLPDYEGAKPEDRRRWVRLDKVVASSPYRFNPLVVVLGPKAPNRAIRSLGDLKTVRLGAEEGTLADAILMSYGGGKLIARITHVVPGRALFDGMERGDYDATLVEAHRLDAYRGSHPGTALSSSGHYHSLGFNVGFLGLASEAQLIEGVNAAIGDMLAKGAMPALAAGAGLTYVAPRQPDVPVTISPAQLRGD